MHGLVRKGLLLSVATGALVLGGAAAAMADTATANGATTGNEGIGAGNVAQATGDNPISVCGDAGSVITANTGAAANGCSTMDTSAAINGSSSHSSGAIAGNVVGGALNAPVQACGIAAHALSAGSNAAGNTCVATHDWVSANGAATMDEGAGAGNVIQLVENAPVQACGDDIGVGAFGSSTTANTCGESSGPVLPPPPPPAPCPPPPICITPPTPPVLPPPPVMPPPPPVNCPPPPPVMPPPPVICPSILSTVYTNG